MKNQCLLPGRNRDFSLLCGIQTRSGGSYSLLSNGSEGGMKLTTDLTLVPSLRMHRMVLTYAPELLCQYCHTNIKYSNSLLCPRCSFCFACCILCVLLLSLDSILYLETFFIINSIAVLMLCCNKYVNKELCNSENTLNCTCCYFKYKFVS